jgi:rubredoxin
MSGTPSRPYVLCRCKICSFEYHEARGMPEFGIAAGTLLENLPDDYACPDCGANKADLDFG